MNMRYNFACALCLHANDTDAAIQLMEPVLSTTTVTWLNHIKLDPDLNALRGLSKFEDMVHEAEIRLGVAGVDDKVV